MINKAIKIIAALVLIGLCLYVVTQNSAAAKVYLTPGWSISASTGVILIIVFVLGLLCATIVAAYFAVRAGLRERRLLRAEQERQAFFRTMLEARSLLAAGEWSKAEALWRKIAKRDPANTIAKVELSRSVEGGGDLKEALRIIDTARISDPSNVEVLFRAAELNLALGNRTAAVDNLALILYHLPSLKAARMARDLSEELGRLQDAFEYQEKVQSAGEEEALLKAAGTRLEFKKLLAEHSEPSDKGKKTAALKNFLKRYGDYAPALEHLATLEAENGKIEDSAQLLVRAAKATRDYSYWHRASRLWIQNNMTDRALAAARAATRNCSDFDRVQAELYLAKLLLEVGKLDEAKPLLESLPQVIAENKIEICRFDQQRMEVLQALYHTQAGESQEAAKILSHLVNGD